tara:strand:- start:3 stop:641 length:639 start_codon:yes stop_codon:yes gene_type:complete
VYLGDPSGPLLGTYVRDYAQEHPDEVDLKYFKFLESPDLPQTHLYVQILFETKEGETFSFVDDHVNIPQFLGDGATRTYWQTEQPLNGPDSGGQGMTTYRVYRDNWIFLDTLLADVRPSNNKYRARNITIDFMNEEVLKTELRLEKYEEAGTDGQDANGGVFANIFVHFQGDYVLVHLSHDIRASAVITLYRKVLQDYGPRYTLTYESGTIT